MSQNVLVNGVWVPVVSDVTTDLNSKLGSAEGRIVLSNRAAPGVLKFSDTNLSLDLSAVANDDELATQKTTNAAGAGAPIVDVRTQTVYLYSAGAWTAQAVGAVKTYISVGQYYWNITNKSLFYASAIDKLDKIGDFGPLVATQAQVNAGVLDNVAVTAEQAKIAWQLWSTQ